MYNGFIIKTTDDLKEEFESQQERTEEEEAALEAEEEVYWNEVEKYVDLNIDDELLEITDPDISYEIDHWLGTLRWMRYTAENAWKKSLEVMKPILPYIKGENYNMLKAYIKESTNLKWELLNIIKRHIFIAVKLKQHIYLEFMIWIIDMILDTLKEKIKAWIEIISNVSGSHGKELSRILYCDFIDKIDKDFEPFIKSLEGNQIDEIDGIDGYATDLYGNLIHLDCSTYKHKKK